MIKLHKVRFTDDFEGGSQHHAMLLSFIDSQLGDKIFSATLLSILGHLNVSFPFSFPFPVPRPFLSLFQPLWHFSPPFPPFPLHFLSLSASQPVPEPAKRLIIIC